MALGVYPPATENAVVDPSPVNCCLTAVSDAVGIETVVDANGDWTAEPKTPLFVGIKLLVDESVGVIELQVNNVVLAIADNGVVGVVKLPVYTTDLTILRLEINPGKYAPDAEPVTYLPTFKGYV